MADYAQNIEDYSSVAVPPPWDLAPGRASRTGSRAADGPMYLEAQAPIYIRTLPSKQLFADRQRIMDTVITATRRELTLMGGHILHGSSIVWTAPITGISHNIQPGDFLFTDLELSQGPLDPRIGTSTGGGCLAVFSSFAGHSAVLPHGYAMAWDVPSATDAATGAPVGNLKPHALMRIRANDEADEVKGADEVVRVMREAWFERNRDVRFVGVAASSYVVDDFGRLEGIAAQVSGAVTLVNTAGRPLLFGDLVYVAIPGEHTPLALYPQAFEMLPDPRAVLRLYRRPATVARAIAHSLVRLFAPRDQTQHAAAAAGLQSSGSYLFEPAPTGLPIGPPPPPGAPVVTPRIGHYISNEQLAEIRQEDRAAMACVAFAEAAILWADAVRRTGGIGGDITAHIREPVSTGDRTVNPLRLGLGAALGSSPADTNLEVLAARCGVVSSARYKSVSEVVTGGGLHVIGGIPGVRPDEEAFVRMRMAASTMLRIISTLDAHATIPPPFGQVIEGGEPGALVSVKIVST